MSPQEIVAAEQARVEALYVIQRTMICQATRNNAKPHGAVAHGREFGSWSCIPCAVERLASMSDAAQSRPVADIYRRNLDALERLTDLWDAREKL